MGSITGNWIILYVIFILCFLALLGIGQYLAQIVWLLKKAPWSEITNSLRDISSGISETNSSLHSIDTKHTKIDWGD